MIRNARCRLTNGSQVWETTTDIFGDFWFKDLPRGLYDLTIEAEGFRNLNFLQLDTKENSLNLDDIPMERC